MSSSRSSDELKSGRIRSTPGWWASGNSTPQSTISSRPFVLEHGHVATDLAQAAERDDAQAVRRATAGAAQLGVRMTHASRDASGHQIGLLRVSICAGVASTRGRPHGRRPGRPAARAPPWP